MDVKKCGGKEGSDRKSYLAIDMEELLPKRSKNGIKMPISEILVYSLIDGYPERETFFATNRHISQKLGLSERVVCNAITSLLEKGLIELLTSRNGSERRILKIVEKPIKNEVAGNVESMKIVDDVDLRFEEIWKVLPSKMKQKKSYARKCFHKASKKKGVSVEYIQERLGLYINTKPEWQDFCHFSTWLNGERWDDDYEGLLVEKKMNEMPF